MKETHPQASRNLWILTKDVGIINSSVRTWELSSQRMIWKLCPERETERETERRIPSWKDTTGKIIKCWGIRAMLKMFP